MDLCNRQRNTGGISLAETDKEKPAEQTAEELVTQQEQTEAQNSEKEEQASQPPEKEDIKIAYAEARETVRDGGRKETDDEDADGFSAFDVSQPRTPVREMDVIEEALRVRRREWFRTHLSYIFAAIGVIIVAGIVFGIYMYLQSTSPMNHFNSALAKDFSTSFDYDVKLTQDDKPEMSYTGTIDIDPSKSAVNALYQADYNTYQYTGAVYTHDGRSTKGIYYNKKWTTEDCTDSVRDFLEFDKDFRGGKFNGGAFLRFAGLTSDYSTRELNKMVELLKKRLSANSELVTISKEKTDEGTSYHYDINLSELFSLIKKNGASVFYRATDYEKFVSEFEANRGVISESTCTMDFTINAGGYMTTLDFKVTTAGKSYGLSCHMSNFSNASVELPDGFVKMAQVEETSAAQ